MCGISLWPKSWAGEQRLGQNAGVEGEVRVLRPQIASLQKPEGSHNRECLAQQTTGPGNPGELSSQCYGCLVLASDLSD